jgi:electron transfer flavoprotein beta subunit
MKVLVTVKRVLDYSVKVQIKPDRSGVDLQGAKMSLNPFDEIALEEAIQLKEKGIVSEVVAVSCGTSACTETLRTALAMGADRACLVECEGSWNSLSVARLLHAVYLREQPDLVLMGKQSIDDDASQIGPMLAALANLPQATFASRLTWQAQERRWEVEREVDGGLETLSLMTPALVTVDLRLNQPRYVTLPGIMKAKKKPLDVLTPQDLGVTPDERLRTLQIKEPPVRAGGVVVPDVATLVDKLHHEARVL